MALYEQTGGSFTPWVKYNAKAGRWYIKGENGDQEVENPTFVADFAGILKIWARYDDGQAPDIVYYKPEDNVSPPSDKHKAGLSLLFYSNDKFGGVVEFSPTSANVCVALSDLHAAYDKDKKDGKFPVIEFKGSEPIKGNYGTNYKPTLEITKWVDDPGVFSDADMRITDEGGETVPVKEEPKEEKVVVKSSSKSEF